MKKHNHLIILLFFLISSCQKSQELSSSSEINDIFTVEEIEDLNILFDFFNQSICSQSNSSDLESCYREFFKRMNKNRAEGSIEIKISFDEQKKIYLKLNRSIINKIWSINELLTISGDSNSILTYNRKGEFVSFIKLAAKDDQNMADYWSFYKEVYTVYPGMIDGYNYTGEEGVNLKLLIAIHYLTLNDILNRTDSLSNTFK